MRTLNFSNAQPFWLGNKLCLKFTDTEEVYVIDEVQNSACSNVSKDIMMYNLHSDLGWLQRRVRDLRRYEWEVMEAETGVFSNLSNSPM